MRICEVSTFLVYKFTSPERAAVPLIACSSRRKGKCSSAKFKREGAKVTPAQSWEHERLRAQGVTVFVVDSVEKERTAVEFQSVL